MLYLPPESKRFLLIAGAVAASVTVLAFCIYLLALDREIRTRFAGARWALPAQVYAAPLEIYPGVSLSRDALRRELVRLGYRVVRKLEGPGTFAVGRERIEVQTRPFIFWDGLQPSMRVEVDFDTQHVAEIYEPDNKQGRTLPLRLDPMLIGSIYPTAGEDRVLVKLAEVPPLLAAGLIHIEDRNFEHHSGLDPLAIVRATWANLRAGRAVQGGSTITQQLVKNFFLNNQRTWRRKINEAFMALLLEAHYSKEEILEAYLNEVHLGQDGGRAVHGFGLASQFYFNKPLAELQAHEIALLIAVVKGPSFYNPRRNPERARERRDLVLSLLAQAGFIAPPDYQAALRKDLDVVSDTGGGVARYPAFVELVKRQLRGQYPETDLTDVGLRIFTTLEPRSQEALEKRLLQDLPRLEKGYKMKPDTLQVAGVVSSVQGGEVLGLVGGRDVRYPGFNRALDAYRPIGSLAKPFVYLAALMQPENYHLATMLNDEPIEIGLPNGTVWAPQNYDKELHGEVPLHSALAQSYNLATVHLGMAVGVGKVREIFRAAGLPQEPPPLPSLFLGALDLSPLEVSQLYGTLAASGYLTPLLAIREVVAQDGQPLVRYPLRVRQTLPEGPVYLLNWALQRVMTEGTGAGAYAYVPPSVQLAGKTGTTDDLRDSWFAGYGDDRVVVIWLGRDDNQPAGLTGAAGALQIWAPLVRDLGIKGLSGPPPPQVELSEKCDSQLAIPYIQGYEPSDCSDWKSLFRW
jgi:penicillin-binding protein 1B